MTALAWIAGIAAVAAFGAAGLAKITRQERMLQVADHLGFTTQQFTLIGVAEAAGAVGVLLGLIVSDLRPLGAFAAVGLVLLGVGAAFFHNKAGDGPQGAAPPFVLAVLALLTAVGLAAA